MAVRSLALAQLEMGHEVTILGPKAAFCRGPSGAWPTVPVRTGSKVVVGTGLVGTGLVGTGLVGTGLVGTRQRGSIDTAPRPAGNTGPSWPPSGLRIVDWTRVRPLDSRLALDVGLLRSAVRPGSGGRAPFDIVHLHSSRAGLVGRAVPLDAPVVFQPHGWSFYPLRGRWRRAAMNLERRLANRTRGHIYCSTGEMRTGVEAGIVPPRQMVALNAPSVERLTEPDPDRTEARRLLGLPENVALYCFVGRLVAQKAPDRLWRAWQEVRRQDPDALLLVLGEGPVPDLDGVKRLGFVANVAAYLDACDALVLVSRWEGLPLAILDAMARGVPVVASTEAIDGEDLGGAGVVVDGDDPTLVAEALLVRRAGSPVWNREATAGPTVVAERYDATRLAARVCEFYRQAVLA
jgi:glycosyltransferase involved in cell wall biosynthesis